MKKAPNLFPTATSNKYVLEIRSCHRNFVGSYLVPIHLHVNVDTHITHVMWLQIFQILGQPFVYCEEFICYILFLDQNN